MILTDAIFGQRNAVVNLTPNTFIGGVAAEIPTKAALATKLNIAESDISYFSVVGSDIEARINVNYGFSNIWEGSAISKYIDEDNLCFKCRFNFCSNLREIKLLGVTTPVGYMYRDCPLLESIHHPLLTGTLNTRNIFNMNSLTHIILNELNYIGFSGSSGYDFTFRTCPKIKKVYLPKCLNFGDTYQLDNTIRNTTGEMYVHSSMFTINDGGLEGDLAARQSAGVLMKEASQWNFTPPSAVTNLSIGTKYATALQLNFTPPTSVNTIDFYECYANGIKKNNITASGGYITGLEPGTFYTITIKAVDEFYNKSVFSNPTTTTTTTNTTNTTGFPIDGLVSYYKLDEASGNQAIDSWGSNHATNYGATIGVPGKIANAYQFEAGKYCEIPFDFTPHSFSIGFWMNPTLLLNYNNQILSSIGWGAFFFHTQNAGGIYCGTDLNSRFTPSQLPSGTLEINKWQHFLYTFAGGSASTGTAKFYKNGVLLSTKTQNKPVNWVNLMVGNSSSNSIAGRVDEIAIWNRAINDVEISNLYNNGNGLTI